MELENKLNQIKLKVEQLINREEQLTNQNNQLKSEIMMLKDQIQENTKNIQELENKNVNLHFTKGLQNEGKNKLKSIIEDLIKEINKGIELLKS